MKTAALRDAMVARVKEAAAKWPTFADMPENPGHDMRITVKADLAASQTDYIGALHSICAVATPSGRIGNDLVGYTDTDASEAGQRLGGGQVMMEVGQAEAEDREREH
jgi:hypothetical protein